MTKSEVDSLSSNLRHKSNIRNPFLIVKPRGEKIVHSGVKAPNLAW